MLRKLLLSYALLILFPLTLLSILIYSNSSQLAERLVTYSAKQSFDQAYNFLSYKIYNIKETSNIIQKNPEIIRLLRSANRGDQVSELTDMYKLRNYLTSMEDGTNITKVRLYVNNGLLYSDENVNIFNLEEGKRQRWFQRMEQEELNNFWSPSTYLPEEPGTERLSYIKNIIDPSSYNKRLGMICFDFSLLDITHLLTKASTTTNSLTYIENQSGEIVAASTDALLTKFKLDAATVHASSGSSDPWMHINRDGQVLMVAAKGIKYTDWKMITVISFDDLTSNSSNIRNFIVILLLIIGTAAYFAAYFISKSITNRITQLARKMRSFDSINATPMERTNGTDEVSQLIEDYNRMLLRIDQLVNEKYHDGQALKTAELRTLQAQISPHFLYNTLDMINWLSWKNRGDDVQRIVEALAKYYRLSLSGGKDMITFEEELHHVGYYFAIQNMRFEERLKLVLDVESSILPLYTLKGILQPLVENAILHGILCKEEKSGTVTLTGRIVNRTILLTVSDDGIGMPVNEEDQSENDQVFLPKKGYGSRNVHNRIQLQFGDPYGIRYSSKPGVGTSVHMTLPLLSEPLGEDT